MHHSVCTIAKISKQLEPDLVLIGGLDHHYHHYHHHRPPWIPRMPTANQPLYRHTIRNFNEYDGSPPVCGFPLQTNEATLPRPLASGTCFKCNEIPFRLVTGNRLGLGRLLPLRGSEIG
jgi:hypothetical protein